MTALLAHLCVEERDARTLDEGRERRREVRPACTRAEHQQRTSRGQNGGRGASHGDVRRHRVFDGVDGDKRHVARILGRHVFGQFEVHRARSFFDRRAKRFAHQRGNARGADDLLRMLGQRPHRRDDVDDLKLGLPALTDRLLPGNEHQRHAAQIGVGRTRGQVQRAGPEGAERDTWLPGQAPVGRRHERRRLLMPGDDQIDRTIAGDRLDKGEIFTPPATPKIRSTPSFSSAATSKLAPVIECPAHDDRSMNRHKCPIRFRSQVRSRTLTTPGRRGPRHHASVRCSLRCVAHCQLRSHDAVKKAAILLGAHVHECNQLGVVGALLVGPVLHMPLFVREHCGDLLERLPVTAVVSRPPGLLERRRRRDEDDLFLGVQHVRLRPRRHAGGRVLDELDRFGKRCSLRPSNASAHTKTDSALHTPTS